MLIAILLGLVAVGTGVGLAVAVTRGILQDVWSERECLGNWLSGGYLAPWDKTALLFRALCYLLRTCLCSSGCWLVGWLNEYCATSIEERVPVTSIVYDPTT